MSARIRAHIRSNVVGYVAIFLFAFGGTASAVDGPLPGQNQVGSADIIDGEVKEADVGQGAVASPEVKNDSIIAGDIAPNSLTSGRIATGAVRTEEVANGQVQAEDLAPGVAPGASGARGWGQVSAAGTLLRSKNVTEVTDPANGIYCIDPGSGIDPTTAVMVVGEDFSLNDTDRAFDDVAHVEWASGRPNCPPGTMEVQTFVGAGDRPSLGETDFGGFDLAQNPEGFTFVIP